MLRKLVQGSRNFLYWLPIIWRDRDWDHWYLWVIMRHKIRAMALHRRSCEYAGEIERLEQMETAIGVLDDLIENVHETKVFNLHEQIYGPSEWERKSCPGRPGLSELEITYPEAEDQEEARRSLLAFGRLAGIQYRIDLAALGELIKFSDQWWD